MKCESFAIISIDSLLVYEIEYYWQVCLDKYTYKILNAQMVDYFGHNSHELDKN